MTTGKVRKTLYLDEDVYEKFYHRAVNGYIKSNTQVHGALSKSHTEALILWLAISPEERDEIIEAWRNGEDAPQPNSENSGRVSQDAASRS